MPQTLFSVDAADIAQALILLSLDELAGREADLGAPALTQPDRTQLRDWIGQAPGLEEFPFNVDMGEFLPELQRRIPADRMTPIIRWAVTSSELYDPDAERTNWPVHPANAWLMALKTALKEETLGYLDLPDATEAHLKRLVTAHGKAIDAADAAFASLVKSWDPHDPQLIEYNVKSKTAWDLKVYQEYCIPRSVILAFAAGQIVKNQADRAFIISYTRDFDAATHDLLRRDLPQSVEGAGAYAVHPWQFERLQQHAAHPLETLFPFAAAGLDL